MKTPERIQPGQSPVIKPTPFPSQTFCLRLRHALWGSTLGLGLVMSAPAALLDVWRADSLSLLGDGDTVSAWTSTDSRTANPAAGTGIPVFKRNVTPAGGPAVRFNRNRMAVASSPVGGRTAFSIALVFRADAVGASDSAANWYGKSGLIDAEQGGVTADWGTVLTETGNVGIGIGAGDTSLYSTGGSLVDGAYHVAVFTWGGGMQAVYVDSRPVVSVASAVAARNQASFSFGGIHTDEGAANRRFVGDMVEARFYDTALSSLEASNVIGELRATHILANIPRIFSFAANTNFLYAGQSLTLAWAVSNSTDVVINNGIGSVTPSNSVVLSPLVTTTYSLTATNTNGFRTAQFTIAVDPGIPTAFNFSTNTAYNTAVGITLRGSDPLGSNLTYAIATPPAHGTLSGTPPNISYLPATNYGGLDSFTFKVNDGAFDSAPATVSLNIIPPALPPTGVTFSTTNISSRAGPGAFLATAQAIDLNNLYGDSHTFTLVPGAADNSKFTLTGASLFAGPTFAGGPGVSFLLRIVATDSTSFSVTQDVRLVVFDVARTVVLNEIHYNPSFNPVRESFIEIHNDTDALVDLSNWRVRGGVDFYFPPGTFLAPHAFAVVAEAPATIQSRYGVTAFGPWAGGLKNEGEEVTLRDAVNNTVDKVDFKNEFPWPIAADGNGPSAQLVNAALDNNLGSSWRSAPPTPGATNLVFSTNAAPNLRQVNHSPNSPRSTNQVTVTCKVTDPDGVASVLLAYQVVTPGNYIPATLPLTTAQMNNLNTVPMTNALNPAFELPANWTTVAMHDDGVNGDAVAGDGIYSALLPQQAHRTLVRYRITCTDLLGASRRAPFEDDPSLNFAYFLYDDLPNYLSFTAASLRTLPIFSLITRDADLNQCTAWFNGADQITAQTINGVKNEARFFFNWEGAMVYDGEVYDHIHYRLRGANGRYHNGKRSLRYKFNDGRALNAKDQYGKSFPTKWRELTTGKGQSNRGGEQFALNEVVNLFLWNKVGVPAPSTLHFHFRVIRGASEAGANQYSGDFWGLNWAQEKYDASFMTAHDLPKGNFYKLVDNLSPSLQEQRYQGAFAPTNGADLFNVENNLTGFQSTDWLNAHANYTNWYRYFTIAKAIRHYDTWPSANKNGAYYFEPLYGASNSFLGRMMQLPYDSTDTWGPTWNNGDDLLYNGIFASGASGGDQGQNPEMQKEYRNTVREIRALLFQPDQINAIIDAHAVPITPVALADHARWSNAPAPASYISLSIPSSPGVTGGLPAYQQDMKNFMFNGGNNAWWIDGNSVGAGGWVTILDAQAADTAIPNTPTITYAGLPGFPADGLLFQSSAFGDPQGAGSFASMQWRVAEVNPTNTATTSLLNLKLEWDAAFASGELPVFNNQFSFPSAYIQPGRVYRARVRHKDNTGRWSRWSDYFQFVPTPPETVVELRGNLVFSEIMFNPPTLGAVDGDGFEFVELKNIGTNTLTLGGLFFSAGINFTFPNGTTLAPGATFLLGRNAAALQLKYPGLLVNGIYSGKLDNDGETLTIRHPQGFDVLSLAYADVAPWPLTTDGFGYSLVLVDAGAELYRASTQVGGSPGANDPASTISTVVINEVLTSSTLPDVDAIELRNPTASPVDVSGWYLTDDDKFPWKYRFPIGSVIPAGSFLVVDEAQFNPTPGIGASFALSSLGDDVYLFSGNANSELTGYTHGFQFGGGQTGVSFGRYVNSAGDEQFPAQVTRSFGSANGLPRVGPVVINEVHYNPLPGGDEFVELLNISGSTVSLFDPAFPTNRWSVNGLGYTFPEGATLAPGQLMLVVAGDPELFRTKYNVPQSVGIFTPVTGSLQDSGERLELLAPDAPTTNGTPFYAVDTIRYNDRHPWSPAADGAGASLQRLVANAYGNEPTNWTAAVPTPGFLLPAGVSPTITGQPVDRSAIAGQVGTLAVTATGPGPLFYQWRFGNDRLAVATNSVLILPSVQLSQAGAYSVDVFNAFGVVTSAKANLAVLIPALFTQHPQSLTVRPGTNIVLTAAASSRTPFTFQWRFNGTPIPGATGTTLPLSNVQVPEDGIYDVVVTDAVGLVTSQPARLAVLVNPVIVQPPLSQTVVAGGDVTISVGITGNPAPFSYQWRRGSTVLTNLTNNERTSFFTLTNVQPSQGGPTVTYRVVVTNAAYTGNAVNLTFFLTVLADIDGDGLPDEWESANSLLTNAPDAAVDTDLDGLSNRAEYLAGTNPQDALSYLKVDQITGGPATLQFSAVSNRTYSVQFKGSLAAPAWQKLIDVGARSTNRIETIIDPDPTPGRFYRLATPVQP